jgi:hypothetical protein
MWPLIEKVSEGQRLESRLGDVVGSVPADEMTLVGFHVDQDFVKSLSFDLWMVITVMPCGVGQARKGALVEEAGQS